MSDTLAAAEKVSRLKEVIEFRRALENPQAYAEVGPEVRKQLQQGLKNLTDRLIREIAEDMDVPF